MKLPGENKNANDENAHQDNNDYNARNDTPVEAVVVILGLRQLIGRTLGQPFVAAVLAIWHTITSFGLLDTLIRGCALEIAFGTAA